MLESCLAQSSRSTSPRVGVNIGGWLVLERWMTPTLFAGTTAEDEYQFMQTEGAVVKLREHQRTFIQEEDWQWLHDNAVDMVRLPIGYWALDGDGPYRSCVGKIDWAMRMGRKYNIDILLCLHGAPGSQNGADHSGKKGDAAWFGDTAYQQQTIACLEQLTTRYRDQPALWGIQLLNEPRIHVWQPTLRRFYQDAYAAIKRCAKPGLVTVFSDAFTPRLMSGALRGSKQYPVMMDHHWYHFFMPKRLQPHVSFTVYYRWLVTIKAAMLARQSHDQPLIIGEWNGIIGGEKLNKYPKQQHNAIVREHIRKQQQAFQSTYATFYWNYKTEKRGVYHFRSMVEDGALVIPER